MDSSQHREDQVITYRLHQLEARGAIPVLAVRITAHGTLRCTGCDTLCLIFTGWCHGPGSSHPFVRRGKRLWVGSKIPVSTRALHLPELRTMRCSQHGWHQYFELNFDGPAEIVAARAHPRQSARAGERTRIGGFKARLVGQGSRDAVALKSVWAPYRWRARYPASTNGPTAAVVVKKIPFALRKRSRSVSVAAMLDR